VPAHDLYESRDLCHPDLRRDLLGFTAVMPGRSLPDIIGIGKTALINICTDAGRYIIPRQE